MAKSETRIDKHTLAALNLVQAAQESRRLHLPFSALLVDLITRRNQPPEPPPPAAPAKPKRFGLF